MKRVNAEQATALTVQLYNALARFGSQGAKATSHLECSGGELGEDADVSFNWPIFEMSPHVFMYIGLEFEVAIFTENLRHPLNDENFVPAIREVMHFLSLSWSADVKMAIRQKGADTYALFGFNP